MADYYQLLTWVVDNLPDQSLEEREKIYLRARTALLSQLRSATPAVPVEAILTEQAALDEAIGRLETRIEDAIRAASAPPALPPPAKRGSWLSDLLARASRDDEPDIAPVQASAVPAPPPAARSRVVQKEAEQVVVTRLDPAPFAVIQPTIQRHLMTQRTHSSVTLSRVVRKKPRSRIDELNKILRKLQNDSPGVEASALISEDGLMIASALATSMEESRVAGMTATLLNLGGRAAMELNRGAVQEVIVRGDRGYAVLISAGRGALLLALANESSKLGLIFFDMKEAIRTLQRVL